MRPANDQIPMREASNLKVKPHVRIQETLDEIRGSDSSATVVEDDSIDRNSGSDSKFTKITP